MSEIIHIKKCLQLILKKMGWKDTSMLVYDDFNILQERILEASGIRLSVHTLERLFGKLKTHKNYNPQKETKKALALYLGYNSWQDFKEKNPIDEEELEITKMNIASGVKSEAIFQRKPVIIAIACIVFIICGYITYDVFRQTTLANIPENIDVQLTTSQIYGVRPHTVEFNFDLTGVSAKNFTMDFGLGKPLEHISKSQKQLFKTYLKPGIHTVRLLADSIPIASTKVFIDLEGWKGSTFTTYEDSETQKEIPGENIFTSGTLYTPPEKLKSLIEPDTHYFVEYLNIHDYKVSGDNMTFETRFRNRDDFDYQLCYDMWFKVIGTHGIVKMHFLRSGCAGFVQMIFGEKHLNGHKQDLSIFTQEYTDWKNARMKVKNQKVEIFFENELIFTTTYDQSIGKVMGLSITSKGAGETDYIKLYNEQDELVHFEDF